MKKSLKKLKVNRETLRALNHGLDDAAGGASNRSECVCPTLSIGRCLTVDWTYCC